MSSVKWFPKDGNDLASFLHCARGEELELAKRRILEQNPDAIRAVRNVEPDIGVDDAGVMWMRAPGDLTQEVRTNAKLISYSF